MILLMQTLLPILLINSNSTNKKALLYDRLIVKKEDGMFKIINRSNTEEIVPDKYLEIQFLESEQEFRVTNKQIMLAKKNSLLSNPKDAISAIINKITRSNIDNCPTSLLPKTRNRIIKTKKIIITFPIIKK